MLRPSSAPFVLVLAVWLATGCARSRTVEIRAVPPDATIRVDDRIRAKGRVTETFTFTSDTDFHRVSVERDGYRRQDVTISPDDPREVLTVTEYERFTKRHDDWTPGTDLSPSQIESVVDLVRERVNRDLDGDSE